MATELERLRVTIEANTKTYDKAMVRVGEKTVKATNKAGRSFKKLDTRMKKTGGTAKNFAVGFLAGFAATVIARFVNPIKGATEALEEFDALSKRIRTSGFSNDFFQTLKFGALEESVDQAKFNKGMEKFVAILAEAKTGRGELVESIKESHPVLVQELQDAKNVDEAFLSLADAVSKAESAEEKALITKAAFGSRLIGMTRLLNRGKEGLDETAKKAAGLGLIIDKKLLKSAEDMENQFSVASEVININFKRAIINLGPSIVASTKLISSMARAVSDLVGWLQKFGEGKTGFDSDFMGKSFLSPKGFGFNTDLSDLASDFVAPGEGSAPAPFKPNVVDPKAVAAAKKKADMMSAASLESWKKSFQTIEQVGQSVTGKLTDAFTKFAETGKLSFREMATSMLADLNRILLNKAFSALVSSVIGGVTGTVMTGSGLRIPEFTTTTLAPRASGGMVTPGRAFRVGERGPETFVPGASGRVMPNSGQQITYSPTFNSGITPTDRAWLDQRIAQSNRSLRRLILEDIRVGQRNDPAFLRA